jgi:hypothetical protein
MVLVWTIADNIINMIKIVMIIAPIAEQGMGIMNISKCFVLPIALAAMLGCVEDFLYGKAIVCSCC